MMNGLFLCLQAIAASPNGEFDPEKFLERVPHTDTEGVVIAPWKRLIIARQMAENARRKKEALRLVTTYSFVSSSASAFVWNHNRGPPSPLISHCSLDIKHTTSLFAQSLRIIFRFIFNRFEEHRFYRRYFCEQDGYDHHFWCVRGNSVVLVYNTL